MTDDAACERLGVDVRAVQRIERHLRSAVREAKAHGLCLFGAPGMLLIRLIGGGSQNNVAEVGGPFDGGDGGDEY